MLEVVEQNTVFNFIRPLLDDEFYSEYIEYTLTNYPEKLDKWLVFKYKYEFDGEFRVTAYNVQMFSAYLARLIIKVLKSDLTTKYESTHKTN